MIVEDLEVNTLYDECESNARQINQASEHEVT